MHEIALMEFDKDNRNFQFLATLDLASIPTKGDKLVFDIDDAGYIFDIYEVHYADNRRIDINVVRISTIADYNSSKFPDIT